MATLKERIIELIQAGNIESAKAELNLLQDGLIDEEGNTLYHEAVSRQDVLFLSWLLTNYQSTLSPNTPNNSGTTCFHIACRQGKTASFMALWNGSKVQQKLLCQKADSDGHTPLHMACLEGQLSVAREIVGKVKEAAFATNKKKQTALHIAAAGGHTSCVRLLTQFKKLIDALDSFDATALHYAVNGGHLVTAKYLLERCHAKSNFITTSQMNIAHAAVASGDFNMVKYIFHKTKERTHVMITSTGASVLHIAAGMGYENILEFLLVQPYIYQYVNIQEKNGWSAAHLAALRNRAGCLAILIGFGADIHSNKDKNRMSVYQIMCYNETSDMRRTFPQLFEQLDFARGNRQTRARHRSPPKSHSSNYVINDSSIAQQNGDKTNRKSASKRTSSLNASYIVKSQMDFTKTNPIAEDSTPGLKQRRFHKNNMALPKSGTTNRVANGWYRMTNDGNDDSDDDINVDDIELIPETPLKTIQQFNNFQHSTYTPTQSTEDLTERKPSSPIIQLEKPNNQISGTTLPVIVDYTQQQENGDGVTIYFHNGSMHTVKVKTTTVDTSNPAQPIKSFTSTSEFEVHQEPEFNNTQETAAVDDPSSHHSPNVQTLDENETLYLAESSDESLPSPPPSITNMAEFFETRPDQGAVLADNDSPDLNQPETSGARNYIPPPDYSRVESLSSALESSSTMDASEGVAEINAAIAKPNRMEQNNGTGLTDLQSSLSHQALLAAARALPVPLPYTRPQSNRYVAAKHDTIQELEEKDLSSSVSHQAILTAARTLPVSLPYTRPRSNSYSLVKNEKQEQEDKTLNSSLTHQTNLITATEMPDPLSDTNSQTNPYTADKESVIKELKERNRSKQTSNLQIVGENESTRERANPDKTSLEALANTTTHSNDVDKSSRQGSATKVSNLQVADYNGDQLSQHTSDSANLESKNYPGNSYSQDGLVVDQHNSADEIEREYLLFAEEELNTRDNRSERSDKESGSISSEAFSQCQEPSSAEVKRDSNSLVRRVPSNTSDGSNSNLELKSSTSFKFNYRAYKKKISTKHDTAADLFEYDPVN